MKRFIELRIPQKDAVSFLNEIIPDDLRKLIEKAISAEQLDFETTELITKADAERRAKRAESHILTRRQAEAMCAAKWGKSPKSYRPELLNNGKYRWGYVGSMGGAAYRMVDTLIEEGMIAANRMDLTEAGKLRLEAWEAKHGVLYVE